MDLAGIWTETQAAVADAYRDLVRFGVDAVQALLVAIVAILLARFVRSRLSRVLGRTGIDPNVVAIARTAASVGIYVVAVAIALSLLGGNWTAVVAALGAGTVAISLALQDVLRSFVAGVYLLVERPFSIGQRIRVGDAEGRVEAIEFRTTVLATDRGDRVLVPNSTVFAAVVTNRSAAGSAPLAISLTGVKEPAPAAEAAIADLLGDLGDRFAGTPEIELRGASADGLAFEVRLRAEPDADPLPLIARLHERFPDAAVALQDG